MRKRQSTTKQKKEKRQKEQEQQHPEAHISLPAEGIRIIRETQPETAVVSKYPPVEEKTEMSSSSTKKVEKREETPGEKQRREQDEAEGKGEVHSAITIDDKGNPVQEHTAGA